MGFGFADKVRNLVINMSRVNPDVAVSDIAERLDLTMGKRPLYDTMKDFQKAGEVERVKRGVYRYIGKQAAVAGKRKVILWRLLRARKVVTVADLQALSGVSDGVSHEWLNMLIRRGIVRMVGADKYRLMNDPIVMPENEDQEDKLMELRDWKEKALAEIHAVEVALAGALAVVRAVLEDDSDPAPDDDPTEIQDNAA